MRLAAILLSAAALVLTAPAARANDSEAAMGLGGLELVQSDAISMDSEDLYISKHEVRVRYRFTNHAAQDRDVLVSFPVPALPGDDPHAFVDRGIPDFKTLDFHTTVDGQPVKLDYVERAEVAGRDVTARLAQLGWPVHWLDHSDGGSAPDFVTRLTREQKAAYRAEGLLKLPYKGADELVPAWSMVTHVTREQHFPAGRTVEVTHRYAPMIGGSVGGLLEKQWRSQKDYADHARHYCADAQFLAAFDRRIAERKRANPDFLPYVETWISYILSSGRNWKGPIGQFRLVVDKDKPENLVSFCMTGVKKIGPTQFEVRRTNFEPRGDLDVLVIEWPDPNG